MTVYHILGIILTIAILIILLGIIGIIIMTISKKSNSALPPIFGTFAIILGMFIFYLSYSIIKSDGFDSGTPIILLLGLTFLIGGFKSFFKVNKIFKDKDGTIYADFWPRLIALSVDGFIIITVFVFIHFLFDRISFYSYIASNIFLSGIGIIYSIFFITKYGATPGKMVAHIKVIKLSKQDVTLKEATLRSIVDIVLSIIYLIAFLSLV